MKIRFYFDEEMDAPHIYKHGVDEDEVEDVLLKPITRFAAKDGAFAATGQTRAGRYVVWKSSTAAIRSLIHFLLSQRVSCKASH